MCLNIRICECLVSNKRNASNFHPLEVVGRGSETHLQMGENLSKRPRGLDVCQQHCKKSAINVSGNVYLYSKMHYHEKMYILYIDHWHLDFYVRFP